MKLKNKVTVKNLIKKIIDRRYSISLSNIFNSRRYYIIRRHKPWAGFFANYLFVIEHIIYAKKKGWIPVVDMENYPTLYNEIYPVDGKMNGWEYYFIQPNNVLLEDAYSSRNYIISDTSHYIKYLPYIEGDNEFQILPISFSLCRFSDHSILLLVHFSRRGPLFPFSGKTLDLLVVDGQFRLSTRYQRTTPGNAKGGDRRSPYHPYLRGKRR